MFIQIEITEKKKKCACTNQLYVHYVEQLVTMTLVASAYYVEPKDLVVSSLCLLLCIHLVHVE